MQCFVSNASLDLYSSPALAALPLVDLDFLFPATIRASHVIRLVLNALMHLLLAARPVQRDATSSTIHAKPNVQC
jgi:hypothetical protein